jgi:hypothetical protein
VAVIPGGNSVSSLFTSARPSVTREPACMLQFSPGNTRTRCIFTADVPLFRDIFRWVATNWQAALLQLYVLIVFASVLYHKGATHSRKLTGHKRVLQKSGSMLRNSLSLAFLALFVISFGAHLIFGCRAENEQIALDRHSQVAVGSFFSSAQFWASTLSCWQAEFFALFVYIILSIFLRQADSRESKPEDAGDSATGEANK